MPSGSLSAPTATTPSKRGRTASSSSVASSQHDARAPSTPATPRLPSAAASQSGRESRESWGNPPRVASGSRSTSAGASVAVTSDRASERARSTENDEDARKRWEARRQAYSHLALMICQQPQRARLCSFKEENETIDRRPVDPPPVLEVISDDGQYPDLLDSTQFFIRASLVSKDPVSFEDGKPFYQPQVTQSGAEATAGDVIQTPERLRHMDGTPGALCIFAKLSVRLPGPFRLKFTLYETSPDGLSEICDTVSEGFEVYSPKQFKGMHESTPLTRHLATQGLKVKIRQGNDSQGKGGNKRRASSNSQFSRQQQRSPGSDVLSPAPPSAVIQTPHVRYSQGAARPRGGPGSAPPYPSQRGLVWHGQFPSYPGYHDYEMGAPRRSPMDDDRPRKVRRSMGHEDVYAAHDISSRLDMTLLSPSSDLSAFSLGSRRPASASSAPPSSRHDWHRASSSPSSYSRHPRALAYRPGYHTGPPAPASLSQYPPGSPPPVLPPIRHSRSRSPSLQRHYDREPRA
ncbi:hypothetical protein CcaverHIS641_0208930 [Cutaneotrichosporon cavernicola]|nr:hypothetical protein CcaverHIS641_0208930 [Cutaneotrichosporon cavernicola]